MNYNELKAFYDSRKMSNGRDVRLAGEHLALAGMLEKTNKITYQVTSGSRVPPESYMIGYHVKSIVGINEDQSPIYGDYHEVEITFPAGYPLTAAAKCYTKTPVWHPNIKWDGRFKGRICGNTREFGKLYFLNMLVVRIGEILQYKNYHAEQTAPFPEDESVARWARDFAEPEGIFNRNLGTYVDDTPLMGFDPDLQEQEPTSPAPETPASPEKPSPKISIKSKRQQDPETKKPNIRFKRKT